jgi:sugar-specific transcriptional regulator TrmB
MTQFKNTLESLGLAKNEARIYEALLREGELGVSDISLKSGVHRRNAYDSLNRLIERGLVFERITSREHLYQAVDPKKLSEILKEKEQKLIADLPDMEALYASVPHADDVVVYRGIEGWKNLLRDIMRVGEDVYAIGAKGTFRDEQLSHILTQLSSESKRKGIKMHWLFDNDAVVSPDMYKKEGFDIEYKFLPRGFETPAGVDIFGDHVVFVSDPRPGNIPEDRSVISITNPQLAEAFRTWFSLLWNISSVKRKNTQN